MVNGYLFYEIIHFAQNDKNAGGFVILSTSASLIINFVEISVCGLFRIYN
jgi:hypothetical protein